MLTDIPLGKLRDVKDNPRKCHLIEGDGANAGRIRTIYFHNNIHGPAVKPQIESYADGSQRVVALHMDASLQRRGWLFMKEAYELEGRPELYEEFLKYQDAMANSSREQYDGGRKPEFPAELMPAVCEDLKKKRKKAGVWTPPVQEVRRAAKKA